jgi:UDP-glucose 4-epimerase
MNTSRRILITGSGGFIGSHLCKHLENSGVNIQRTYSQTKSEDRVTDRKNNVDVTSMDLLNSLEKGADTIVHLAAKTSVPASFSKPYETYYTNILGTLNLLELARTREIRNFIFISTYVYGQPSYLPIDEKHQVNPHSPYHKSKLAAEQICQNYSADFGMNVVTLRPFYIYGPNSRPQSFIPSAIRQIREKGSVILNSKRTALDFLFVEDFVELIKGIIQQFPIGYSVYNVGYGKSLTLRQVCELLARMLNKELIINYDEEMRPGDAINMVADISKVSKSFNWKPIIDLERGLELIIKNEVVTPI